MSTYFQLARQEGRQEGRLEGRQDGRQEGEALVLLRLLRLKFGAVPEDVQRRIEQADAETILTWSERILSVERIEDVIR